MKLSPKAPNQFVITETNWPLTGVGGYAPVAQSDPACIDLDSYVNYMVRYYIIALASGSVTQVFWHQLLAVGYGLVSALDEVEYYPAYSAFKNMLEHVKGATYLGDESVKNSYCIHRFEKDQQQFCVAWSIAHTSEGNGLEHAPMFTFSKVINRFGEEIPVQVSAIKLTAEPVYIYE